MGLKKGRICPHCGAKFSWSTIILGTAPWLKLTCEVCHYRSRRPLVWNIMATLMFLCGGTATFCAFPFLHERSGRDYSCVLSATYVAWMVLCNFIGGCFVPWKIAEEKEQSAFAAALSNIGRRIEAHLPPGLREYSQTYSEAAMKRVRANLSCPNCGRRVVSAERRILRGCFLSGTCPYCETGYRGGRIAPIISAVIGISVYMDLDIVIKKIPFLPQILLDVISSVVLFPICLFIPFVIFGALTLLLSPLHEVEQEK